MNARLVGCILLGFGALVACDAPTQLSPPTEASFSRSADPATATGGGQYLITLGTLELPGDFSFNAIQTSPDGAAEGRLRFTLDFQGEPVEFHGDVTCMTRDLSTGRAWIGGVITRNASVAEPYASGEIFNPGKDIWFRVLDSGEGAMTIDRTTFVGFEGGAGIITSAEYCDVQLWAPGDARTWPVTGNVQVR